ncbi:RNA binding protein squid [Echinococcus multilocularis]|uniref:RNA binding protein squid n=1 Tax=Echinococcus multilocularis TaxID=6211 RepID=A0A068XZM0_ECHMU|nr:RNA binding protein squid [Echinococcus multilocularis]
MSCSPFFLGSICIFSSSLITNCPITPSRLQWDTGILMHIRIYKRRLVNFESTLLLMSTHSLSFPLYPSFSEMPRNKAKRISVYPPRRWNWSTWNETDEHNRQKAVASWKSLKQCSREAKRLEEAVKQLGPIPMTQMQVKSEDIQEENQKKEKTDLKKNEVASNDVEVGHQLVVDGLPPVPKLNDILSFYGKFGAVTHVRIDEEMHRAFVVFSTAEAVQKAVAAAPPRFKSANLRVSLCEEHGWRYATS